MITMKKDIPTNTAPNHCRILTFPSKSRSAQLKITLDDLVCDGMPEGTTAEVDKWPNPTQIKIKGPDGQIRWVLTNRRAIRQETYEDYLAWEAAGRPVDWELPRHLQFV